MANETGGNNMSPKHDLFWGAHPTPPDPCTFYDPYAPKWIMPDIDHLVWLYVVMEQKTISIKSQAVAFGLAQKHCVKGRENPNVKILIAQREDWADDKIRAEMTDAIFAGEIHEKLRTFMDYVEYVIQWQ